MNKQTQEKYSPEELKLPTVEGLTPLEKYRNAVIVGKNIVHSTVCHQVKLAHLATQVCTIRHGGISNGFYTIKDFAKDIGMNAKTLQNWVIVYRNIIQRSGINIHKVTPEIWSAATRIRNNHELKNSVEKRANGTVGKKSSGNLIKTPEEIKTELTKVISGEVTDQYKCTNWASELLHISNKLPSCDLSKVDKNTINEMLMHSMFIKEHLNLFLTNKLKKKV